MFYTFLSICIIQNLSFANNDILGVCNENIQKYHPVNGVFVCFDGSNKIPFNFVNDDYCDCSDGSDEPGTNACNYNTFCCKNVGFYPKNISSLSVKDKICDCCDGSDEISGLCSDTCTELARIEKEKILKEYKKIESGKDARKFHIDNYRNLERQMMEKITFLQKSITQIKSSLDDLTEKSQILQKIYDEKYKNHQHELALNESSRIFELLDTDKNGIVQNHSIIEYLSNISKNYTDLINEIPTVESFNRDEFINLWSRLYLKNQFSKVKSYEKSYDEDENSNDHDLEDPEFFDEAGKKHFTKAESEVDEEEPHDPSYEEPKLVSKPKDVSEISLLKLEIDVLNGNISQLGKYYSDQLEYIEKLENFDKIDFGPEKEFSYLYLNYYELKTDSYTYKFFPFINVTQENSWDGKAILLGVWKEWSSVSSHRSQMVYGDGSSCYTGKPRTVIVNLDCDQETLLSEAFETQICSYELKFSTPAACGSVSLPSIRDEL